MSPPAPARRGLLRRLGLSPFNVMLLCGVAAAFLWPAQGRAAEVLGPLTTWGVALLFLAHGATLPREAIVAGLTRWRLHLFILAVTFAAFPLVVLALAPLGARVLSPDLLLGFLFLGALPSAVSSSVVFTAMARGNVAVAVCSAAASNVAGMLLTPLLVDVMVGAEAAFTLGDALVDVGRGMLLPFALGHAARPLVVDALTRHPLAAEWVDQVVLVLIVYAAFSQSVADGVWREAPALTLLLVIVSCLALLAGVLGLTTLVARRLGFPVEDEIPAVFCGSKKSLASGLPMAKVLFAGHPGFGLIVLPILCYNQLQIVVGAQLAQRYAARPGAREPA